MNKFKLVAIFQSAGAIIFVYRIKFFSLFAVYVQGIDSQRLVLIGFLVDFGQVCAKS